MVNFWADSDKIVIVAGLTSGQDKKPFVQMSNLMAVAEDMIHLKAKCECGNEANFTTRFNFDNPRDFIGGAEKY